MFTNSSRYWYITHSYVFINTKFVLKIASFSVGRTFTVSFSGSFEWLAIYAWSSVPTFVMTKYNMEPNPSKLNHYTYPLCNHMLTLLLLFFAVLEILVKRATKKNLFANKTDFVTQKSWKVLQNFKERSKSTLKVCLTFCNNTSTETSLLSWNQYFYGTSIAGGEQ